MQENVTFCNYEFPIKLDTKINYFKQKSNLIGTILILIEQGHVAIDL